MNRMVTYSLHQQLDLEAIDKLLKDRNKIISKIEKSMHGLHKPHFKI
jgi:hypothetical protein